MTRTPGPPTHVDGVEVVAVEPASGPHPHPRYENKIVPYTNVIRLLLADERELFMCQICYKFRHVKIRSVTSHMTAHSASRYEPHYPDDVLRELVRTVRGLRRDGVRDVARRAAQILNEGGLRTLRGEEWTAPRVSSLYRDHKNRYRNVRPTTMRTTRKSQDPGSHDAVGQTVGVPSSPVTVSTDVPTGRGVGRRRRSTHETLEEQTRGLATRVGGAALALAKLEQDLLDLADRMAATSAPPVDPQLAEKAARWDQVKNLLG